MADDMRLEYVVDADVSGLENMNRSVSRVTQQAGRNFRQLDNTVSKLSSVFSALTAAISANQVIKYAESWTIVNNKLSNSIRINEDLADVTERVFKISQDSRSGLDATASLYARLERATRATGVSTAELAVLTETINKAFIVSGATASEAESAVIQLSQGLASGALRGEEFNSVNEQGNRLIVALSESLGVTSGKLRELAFDGKLTTDIVVKGLLNQGNKIAAEFANTMQTFGQATTVATNNLTKWVGESATVKTVVGELGNGVVSLSQNLDTVANIATYAAVVMGSKLTGGVAASTQAYIANAVASQKQAVANAAASQAALRRAAAERQSALALVSTAKIEEVALRGKIGHAFAIDNLVKLGSLAATSTDNYNRALIANTAAQRAASTAASVTTAATNTLKTAMSFLGGPVGVIMLAASALYFFKKGAEDTQGATDRLNISLDEMGKAQARLIKMQLGEDITKTEDKLKALNHRMMLATAETTALTDAKREQLKIELAAAIEAENLTLDKQIAKLKEINSLIDGTRKKQQETVKPVYSAPTITQGPNLKEQKKAAKEMLEITRKLEEQEKERYQLEQQQRQSAISASPALAEDERFKKEIENLKLAEDLKLVTKQEYMNRESQLIAEHEANKQAMQEQTFRAMSEGNALLLDTFNSLENAATNVFSGMLSGTMSATDAMKAFGNAILNEAIGALVKMGVEQLKQAVIGKSMQAASTAAAVAQGAAIAAAMQPAAMAASIATSGAAAAAGMSGYTSAMASAMIPVAGGRLYGGPTQAGKMYRVNENGRPEFFQTSSGQSYMMSGQSGHVTPASDLGGSSINIVQNFNVDASATYDQKAMSQLMQATKAQTMEVLQQQMRQGGMLSR